MDAYQACHHVQVIQQDRIGQLPRSHRDSTQLREQVCHLCKQEGREINYASELGFGQQQR